jgi:endoglycosylceramidase
MRKAAATSVLALASALVACHSSSGGDGAKPAVDAGPAGSCTIAPPAVSDWRVRTDGTLFRDSLNRVLLFRGVNAGERSKFAPFVPFDFPDGGYSDVLGTYMDIAASWGINAMRVPFAWAALEPVQGQNDATWLDRYDQLIDAAWAHGIYSIVDFHQDIYAEVFCGDGFPTWTVPYDAGPLHHDCPNWEAEGVQNPGVLAGFDAFWDASAPVQGPYMAAWDLMVARYKDKPGVIGFEPINEPLWGTAADESAFEATTLTDFYGQMVTRMRGQAPTSLVFIDPPGLDGATLATTLGEPNGDAGSAQGIVFAPHYYPIIGAAQDPVQGLGHWTAVGASWNVPTFVGEFGVTNTSATVVSYMTSVWNAFDALSLSATEWEYSIAPEEWDSENFSMVAGDGGENPVASVVLRPFARAVAGSAITQGYDPASQTFTVTYTPTADSAVSEMSLPARAYPKGYDVAITGACFDTTSKPGTLLVQPTASATQVAVTVTPKP